MRKAIAREAVHAVHPRVPNNDAQILAIKREARTFKEVYIKWKPKVVPDPTVQRAYENIIESGVSRQ